MDIGPHALIVNNIAILTTIVKVQQRGWTGISHGMGFALMNLVALAKLAGNLARLLIAVHRC